jgi:hypothetical protein
MGFIMTLIACFVVSLAIFLIKIILISLFKGIVLFRILGWFFSLLIISLSFYNSQKRFAVFEPPSWGIELIIALFVDIIVLNSVLAFIKIKILKFLA